MLVGLFFLQGVLESLFRRGSVGCCWEAHTQHIIAFAEGGICLGWAVRTGVIRCRPRHRPGDDHGRAAGTSCYSGRCCAMHRGVDGLGMLLLLAVAAAVAAVAAGRHNHMPLEQQIPCCWGDSSTHPTPAGLG